MVLARLYEHVGPIDRLKRYEDPLQAALEVGNLGEVTGGGSQLNALGGIEFADIEIMLANLDGALRVVVGALERAGALQGSELLHDGKVLREFGTQQCLAVYLDGVSLPDEVYANLDFDAVVEEIENAVGPGSYRGFWQGPEETGIYFFGSSAEEMFTRVKPVLDTVPVGQNARVVIRHGKESLRPRTVRIPRR